MSIKLRFIAYNLYSTIHLKSSLSRTLKSTPQVFLPSSRIFDLSQTRGFIISNSYRANAFYKTSYLSFSSCFRPNNSIILSAFLSTLTLTSPQDLHSHLPFFCLANPDFITSPFTSTITFSCLKKPVPLFFNPSFQIFNITVLFYLCFQIHIFGFVVYDFGV